MADVSCPWWEHYAPQTHFFCEEAVCGPVKFPADTASLLAFVVAGLLIRRAARRSGRPELVAFGTLTLLVGVASAPVHVTGTYWGQVIDLWSMFLIGGFLVADALRRLRGWSLVAARRLYLAIGCGSALLMVATQASGIPLFALLLAIALVAEVAYLRSARGVDLRPLTACLGLFGLSFGVWCLDYFRIACWPGNHLLTGHGVWHLLNSACLYLLFRYLQSLPAVADRAGTASVPREARP